MEQMKKEIFARVRVVTVDLDNTLWKTLPVIKEANKALFHFLGAQYPGILDRFPPESWRALQDKMMENFPEDSHDLSKVRLRAIEYAANICGEKDPAAVSQEAFSVFIQKRNDTKDFLFPGVLNTLKSLKRRGYVIGSLTNGNADVFAMDHFNGIFSFHVCASSAGAMKPQPAPFKKAFDFAKLHSLPEVIDESCVLHVGDSIHSDVIPGKLFGFKTCWVKTGDSGEDQDQSPPAEADVTCEQFAELAMVLMGPPRADEGSHL